MEDRLAKAMLILAGKGYHVKVEANGDVGQVWLHCYIATKGEWDSPDPEEITALLELMAERLANARH